jgi:hypothetical protein
MRISYCIAHNFPNATKPDLCWQVNVRSLVNRAETPSSLTGDFMWVPVLPIWTPDTVRMFFHELAAYVPADPHALVGVNAKVLGRRGPAPKTPRPPRFDNHVEFWLEARGWRAEVSTWLDDRNPPGAVHSHDWSQPMQEFLLGLAQRSPFALVAIDPVDSAYGQDFDIKPSRRNVAKGWEWPTETVDD